MSTSGGTAGGKKQPFRKRTKREVAEIQNFAFKLLRALMDPADVVKAMVERYGVSFSQARRHLVASRKYALVLFRKPKAYLKAELGAFCKMLAADVSARPADRLAAVDRIIAMYGLSEPDKPEGNGGLTPSQRSSINELRVSMIANPQTAELLHRLYESQIPGAYPQPTPSPAADSPPPIPPAPAPGAPPSRVDENWSNGVK